MKSSPDGSVPIPNNTPAGSLTIAMRGSRRSITVLVVVLVVLIVALPISRHILFSKAPAPAASARLSVQMKYYAQRVTDDPSDVGAYVALGVLDEKAGYFTDAVHRFYAARALGAADKDIVMPLGRSLVFLGHYDEARTEMEKAVRLMPDSIKAAGGLADVYDAESRRLDASAVMTNYLNRHPGIETDSSNASIGQLEQLLYYYLSERSDDMALRMANDLVRLAPSRPEGYAVSGQILLVQKQPRLALQRLETAVRLAPDDSAICYTYGVALSAVGRDDDALKQWQKSVLLNPRSIDAYYRLSEAYDRRKDYYHCSMALQKIALSDLSNGGAAAATATMYEKAGKPVPAAYWRSVAAAARKDYAGQLKYAEIAAKDPEWHKRALGAIAAAYRGLNRMKDYIAVMQQMTSSNSASDDITMAGAYGAADRLEDQTRALKSALEKSPADPAKVHSLLSQVADRQGLRDEAEAEMQKAIALKPNVPGYHSSLGSLYLERRSDGNRLTRAIEEYKRLIQLDPYEVEGYQQLGIAYEAKGDMRRASHSLEHALDLLPGDGATYEELARVYARMGDKAGSQKMFDLYHKYIAFDLQQKTLATQSRARSKDPAAQVALGDFLEKSGNYSDALQYYRLANSLNPHDSDIKAKIQRMDTILGQSPD